MFEDQKLINEDLNYELIMLRSQITQQNTSENMLKICIDRRNLGRLI